MEGFARMARSACEIATKAGADFVDASAGLSRHCSVNIEKNKSNKFIEAFSGKPLGILSAGPRNRAAVDISIPARGRVWIRRFD